MRPSLLARLGEVHRGEVAARLHGLPHLGQAAPGGGQGVEVGVGVEVRVAAYRVEARAQPRRADGGGPS